MRRAVNKKERSHHHPNAHGIFHCMVIGALLAAALIGCSNETKKPIALRSEIDANDSLQLQALEGSGIYADGWVGDDASVSLLNPGHTRLLSLCGVNVQTGMKDEKLRLKLEFQSGKIESIEVAETGTFDKLLLMPSIDGARDTVQFRLSSSKVFVPARLRTSKDDRELSFQLVKIALVDAATMAEKMPEAFEFPRQEESNPNLVGVYKDGWIADSGSIVLHNLQGKSSVEIRGFVPPDIFPKIANLEIRINGVLLVKEQLPKKNRGYFRTIFQLPEDFAGSASVPLTLKPSGAFVPAERGINSDKRRISYQLQYIGLR
jgi:hypothetical protein